MYAYWKLWVDVLNIGLDAQRVIAMRLAKIAKGGAAAEAECRRMVSEKFLAAAAARDAEICLASLFKPAEMLTTGEPSIPLKRRTFGSGASFVGVWSKILRNSDEAAARRGV